MFKRILVPVDGSRFGSKPLEYAIDIARRFDAEVVILHVVKPAVPVTAPTFTYGAISPATAEIAVKAAEDEEKRNVSRSKRYLSRKAREIKSSRVDASYRVLVGDPSTSIMDFSKKEKIDLIVMSTHGKSGLKRAFLGSVADAVIRESGKPVLVIRPRSLMNKNKRDG